MINDNASGTVTGTGAAINVLVGFQPKKVKLYNISDAGGLAPMLEWVDGMGTDKGVKYLGITDNGVSASKSHQLLASGGVSQYAGTAGVDSEGFTIGTDTDINVNSETIVYEAYR